MGVKTNADGISISPLKTALQYADAKLGITVATSTYGEICGALADYFPDATGVLYDSGTEYVPWQTGVATILNGYTTVGGFDKNASNMTGRPSLVSNTNQVISVNTADKIPFSSYSTLHIKTSKGEYTANCSGWADGYLAIFLYNYFGNYTNYAYVNTTKNNMQTSAIAGLAMDYYATASPTNVVIEKIWLE